MLADPGSAVRACASRAAAASALPLSSSAETADEPVVDLAGRPAVRPVLLGHPVPPALRGSCVPPRRSMPAMPEADRRTTPDPGTDLAATPGRGPRAGRTAADVGLVVRPFRGLRYDPGQVSDLAAVTSPPYDVIDRDDAEHLAGLDPHNVVRLILPRAGTGSAADGYAQARSGAGPVARPGRARPRRAAHALRLRAVGARAAPARAARSGRAARPGRPGGAPARGRDARPGRRPAGADAGHLGQPRADPARLRRRRRDRAASSRRCARASRCSRPPPRTGCTSGCGR